MDVEGEGPWEVQWRWTTGLSGTDRFPSGDKALIFWDEMVRRTDPPFLEVSVSARNVETGERLGDYVKRTRRPSSVELLSSSAARPWFGHTSDMATCGTCGGTGQIPIIQTGKTKKCTRCNGTGKE
jgi:hypothetical protein